MESIPSVNDNTEQLTHSSTLVKAVETTPNCNVIIENVLVEVVESHPTTETNQDDDDMPVILLEKADKVPSPSSSIEAHAVVIMDSSHEAEEQHLSVNNEEEQQQAILVPRAAAVVTRGNTSSTTTSPATPSRTTMSSSSQERILDDDDEEVIGGVEETLREIQESEARAEFLSIMMPPPPSLVRQTSLMKDIGIHFINDQPGVVESIEEDGTLFADLAAVIQPGDLLVSINGKHTTTQEGRSKQQQPLLSNSQLLSMMQHSYAKEGLILVFQNRQENARGNVVASVLTKPSGTSLLGIKLGSFGRGRKIKITDIRPDGITAQSLLNVGDTILMVNGVPCVNSTTNHVVDVLRGSPQYVYIVAQTGVRNAVTIAECTTTSIAASSLNMLLLIPFGGLSS